MIARLACATVFLLPLMSCASLTNKQCERGDWYGIGVSDGQAGRSISYLDNHREACADVGITPDRAVWLKGREAGLRQYCTPENAYHIGKAGDQINNVCQPQERLKMSRPYLVGQQYYDFTQQINRLKSEKNSLEEDIRLIEVDYDPETDKSKLRRKWREISRIERRIEDLEDQRSLYTLLYALYN
ncbi:DUF2799 domain-containing protein [Parasulfitobacter algicola]|uniref:DUF2799 domain-containing protein n=1 Tax=Parasulfitobacter algicola TaxID=2614809 RepID=A0ABX2IQE3_9RHOB|nr:DUF2799 domain-containing protein [Sulfitobacter algicola]NSX55084.1 DUF2799 domain-containing protein [Sulfitobacter algicola]